MPKSWEQRVRDEALPLLRQWLGGEVRELSNSDGSADVVVESGRRQFLLQFKPRGNTATLAPLIAQWQHPIRHHGLPLVVVPYMTPSGAMLCEAANINWFDLAGNAEIRGPDLLIHVRGKRPRTPTRMLESAFAPTASRIVRLLLFNPQQEYTQKELVAESGLAQGFVSNILRDLVQKSFVVRDGRTLRVRDPNLLLTAWQEQYQFDKHHIMRGHWPARSGEALLQTVSEMLTKQQIQHAATGLAAAWLWSHFAMFRLTTVYLQHHLNPDVLKAAGFRETDAGANLWLVVPKDEGVFARMSPPDAIPCVHPLQAYLDLAFQPERAAEAAERLRADHLPWIHPYAPA